MFYIYRWTHVDSGRAYIGKGQGRRAWTHLSESALRRGYYFHNALLKFGADRFALDFLAEGLTESEALAAEVRFIAEHGTKRPGGFNLTNGGEGVSGLEHSEESREKMSQAKRGMKWSPEVLAQRGASISATYSTAEGREQQSAKASEMWATADEAKRERMVGARWKSVVREPCDMFLCRGTRFNGTCGSCQMVAKGAMSPAAKANICFLLALGAKSGAVQSWFETDKYGINRARKHCGAVY